ncbi:MAG TPA: nuclear transport factor 2 family protein [Sphingomicrobium sp.]
MKPIACLLVAAAPLLMAAAPTTKDWKSQTLKSAAPDIDRANDEWTRAIVTGDADVLSGPYASNGIFIGPDGTAVHGKSAVRAMYARRPAGVKVVNASISSDGRAAHDPNDVYEWGTARMTIRRGKAVRASSGRYLTVWHRQGKHWVITRNIAF